MHLSSTLMLAVALLCSTAPPKVASDQTCSRDTSLQKANVLDAVKQEILLRLGLQEEPPNPENLTAILQNSTEFLKEHKLMTRNQELTDKKVPCGRLNILSKDTNPFHPEGEIVKMSPLKNFASADYCRSDLTTEFYNGYRVKFSIKLSKQKFITDAQLRLKRFPLEGGNPQNTRIDLYLVAEQPPAGYFGEEYKPPIDSVIDDYTSNSVNFNVSKAIKLWAELNDLQVNQDYNSTIEFEIRIRCYRPLPRGAFFVPSVQFFKEHKEGVLVLTTYKEFSFENDTAEAPVAARHKRGADINDDLVFCRKNEIHCCLTRFRINFERDFNWTWIISPKDIAFNYCGGECPRRWSLSTGHAALLDIYRIRENPTAAPEPCCVPNTYASLTLSIYINRKLSHEYIEDLVATSCACR